MTLPTISFSHLTDSDLAFQWHGDAFDLPEGATLLATGDRVPNQAFRVGDLAWGTQFHCEVNRSELEFWLEEFTKVGDLRSEWGRAEQVREEAERFMAEHESRGREVFERFRTWPRAQGRGGRRYTRRRGRRSLPPPIAVVAYHRSATAPALAGGGTASRVCTWTRSGCRGLGR